MRTALVAFVCSALVGFVALPPPAFAQQKTVKVCRDEWQVNKAANQAAGVTEKAYVDKCRSGAAAAQPAATPAAAPAAAPAGSGQKTVKICRDEWSANKAAYQAGGVTQKAYVDKCRAGETVAVPTMAAPAAAPASSTSAAPQKTVKACRDEWQAQKAAYQAGGITEKAYVDKCRAGETVALPSTAAPVTTAAPTATTPAAVPQKTVKACRDEWQAQKAAYQAGGITEKAYVDKCRAGETVALPSTPAPTPVSAPPVKPSKTVVPAPGGDNQFTTETLAKGRCPADTVVWANTDTKVYHFSGNKRYGNTKQGAYMCEKDAGGQGFRAAKNEKHT